jgi:tetratricopeptide (TPR) repeat protein
MLLFTVLAVGNFVAGLRLGYGGWQGRRALLQEPLRREPKRWADRSAILLGVPLGVLLHELSHALATWLFGGSVVEFGYFFYWGYVLPAGEFSAAQDWFISLAGTLGSLVYGLLAWLALSSRPSSIMRYLGLRTLRFQLYFALIYYPLFTLFTFVGDWRVIYDFSSTPLLSSVTLVVHLALLGMFFWFDRQGNFEMPAFNSLDEQRRYEELRRESAFNPQDVTARLRLVEILRQGGATSQARAELRRVLKAHPNAATAHLLHALMLSEGKRQIPAGAIKEAETALALGLSDADQAAFARGLLAQYKLDVGRVDEAVRELDQALAAISGQDSPYQAQLLYLRARAHRRKSQFALAQSDIAAAIRLAEAVNNSHAVAQYRQEAETIQRHAG